MSAFERLVQFQEVQPPEALSAFRRRRSLPIGVWINKETAEKWEEDPFQLVIKWQKLSNSPLEDEEEGWGDWDPRTFVVVQGKYDLM